MPVLSSAVLLLRLVLLTAPLEDSVPSAPPGCEAGTRHLVLTADTPREALSVCIHAGLPTNFFFGSQQVHVDLPGRERFQVIQDGTGLALMPTRALKEGERVPVTVSFEDGTPPAAITLTLVVHPSEAARLVEVTRPPPPRASPSEGEQQAQEQARQCREEKTRLEAQCSGQGGLLGLLAQKLLSVKGIAGEDLSNRVTSHPGNTLQSMKARSYRSDTARLEGGHKVVRLATELLLLNSGSTPWTPAGAVLVGPKGEEWKALGVGPLEPIAPGKQLSVGVEVEMTEEAARGTFTLKLWSQEPGGEELFDGVTFP